MVKTYLSITQDLNSRKNSVTRQQSTGKGYPVEVLAS